MGWPRALLVLALTAGLGGCIDIPGGSRREPDRRRAQTGPSRPAPPPSASTRQCLADLSRARVNYSVVPDRDFGGGCAIRGTVRMNALATDSATLGVSNLGPVACPLADAFAGWARFGVNRAAQQILGSPVVTIETFGSYSCRNVAGTSRRSAHSLANAIDVSGFVLEDGRRITVLGDWNAGTSAERRFLRVIHDSACKRFGTVLSPEYNAAHRDHFHVEADGKSFCR
jgi:hypothetical protein